MRKKLSIFFAFTIMVLLCMAENTYAMGGFKQRYQQFKQNFNWKTAAAVGFAGGCSLAQYGLAYEGYRRLVPVEQCLIDIAMYDKEFEKLPDVDPLIESFVKRQAREGGITQQGALRIKAHNHFSWATCRTKSYDWIFMPIEEIEVLKRSLNKGDSFNFTMEKNERKISIQGSDYLKYTAATIHHESGHIINDYSKQFLGLAIPAGVAALSFGVRKKFIGANQYWLKNLIKPVSGIAIGPLSACGFYSYAKFRELKADDNIKDNIHLLRAKKQQGKNNFWLREDGYRKETWYERLVNTHPYPTVRIKRLKKRIKALKAKGDPKSFEDPLASKEDGQVK